jgi:hypothetical protein
MVPAGASLCGPLRGGEYWKQNRRKHKYDRNNDQQLDQSKSGFSSKHCISRSFRQNARPSNAGPNLESNYG